MASSVASATAAAAANSANDDCYFYYYATCAKGAACPFRHEPLARAQETVCTYWQQGKCAKPRCPFRHLDVGGGGKAGGRGATPCFFETQPGGCRKPHCPFMHDRPKEVAAAAVPKSTIIVNKNKMSELGGILNAKRAPAHSRLGPRSVGSVKDRLGNSGAVDDVEVFEYSDDADSEEEALRASAIKTIDLRKRLSHGGAATADEEYDPRKSLDSAYAEEYRAGKAKSLSVVGGIKKKKDKKEKKKEKKEKKLKKKMKKESKAHLKALKELKADGEGEEQRRIVTRLEAQSDEEEERKEEEVSLADRIAAMREKEFASVGGAGGGGAGPKGRVGSAPATPPREASPKRSRKRREDSGEEETKSRRKRRSSETKPSSSSSSPTKKKKRTTSKEDLREVEKFLEEDPQVKAATSSSADVMKELDELLQD